ncbi:TlpA family protein disulfide reductase [Lentibacillus juripiscarius]|uniref:TlpA family protein disulfide reductase n=1 Tax=Lentibacillus juripiscarius TaxID=257446 RepID=A0ABW5V4K0_9BACI
MKLREQMPELTGASKWLNSKPVSRADLIGEKPTLIHFWSISCDMCKDAMPKLNEFRDGYKQDLNIISVHMPRSEKDQDLDAVKKTAAEHDITQPTFVDNEHTLTNAFAIKYVPAYYIFDVSGRLRHRQSGGAGMKMLTKRINRVLDETNK